MSTPYRLIAAAPDLLAALKDAQEAIFWYGAGDFQNEKGERAEDVITAAIAKATGEPS